MYKHFNLKDRFTLATLIEQGYEQWEVAEVLGRDPATITRELIRNSRADGIYEAKHAQMLSKIRRRRSKIGSRKIENDVGLARRLESRLHPLISPEVIAHDENVSAETVYAWIYRSQPELKERLPQRGRKRRRYGSKRSQKQGWTRDVRSIEERTAGAENRSRIGHFEGDTVRLDGGAKSPDQLMPPSKKMRI
jgi:IS30 family transposase